MLTIKNRNKLLGSEVVVDNTTYTIDGMYSYPTHYKIHLRCFNDSSVDDELIILLRTNNTNHKKYLSPHSTLTTHYYDMYWNVDPQNRLLLSINTIEDMKWFKKAIESILEKRYKPQRYANNT